MQVDKVYFENLLNKEILAMHLLKKGERTSVYTLETPDKKCILKTSEISKRFQTEADMLKDIKKYNISAPEVYSSSQIHLLMEFIEESSVPQSIRQVEAAKLLSRLHSVTNESRMYGYYYDTAIGPFEQINEQTQYNWTLFLGQMRIMPMARICYDRGYLPKETVGRLEELCTNLYRRIDMSQIMPSLLHGDIRKSKILYNIKEPVMIAPAIYFGDREMELASILLFHTFGKTFFDTYEKDHPLSSDFYETKVPLYQLYPLLVHLAIYGENYLPGLLKRLDQLKT